MPFLVYVPELKPNSKKKGSLIIKGLLRNLAADMQAEPFDGLADKRLALKKHAAP